jgi:hypothetical protein
VGILEDPAVRRLIASGDPSIEYLTRTDVAGQSTSAPTVRHARARILEGPKVAALLSGQHEDGGFGNHPYRKWTGAFWRLISLVELHIPAGEPRAMAAFEQVLGWLASPRRARVNVVDGRVRRCASMEGYGVAVGCRLGMAGDPRVSGLASSLASWQWEDGGWNCDTRPPVSHSSFHETLGPLWGLAEYHKATDDREAKAAADRAAEFFLHHRMYRSHRTGAIDNTRFLNLRWPPYWHYDVLRGMTILHRAGRIGDPRTKDALDVIASKRQPDGTWRAEGAWWRSTAGNGPSPEVVDWGRSGPNEMVTLSALRVLIAEGRL